MQAVEVEGFLLFKKLHCNVAVRFDARHRQIFFHAKFFIIPQHTVVCESKAVSVNVTKERMVILVKLRVALSRHASVTHHDVYAVRNVNLHFPSRQRTFEDPQTVIEVVGDTGCIRTAHLAFTSQRVQDFVLRVSA